LHKFLEESDKLRLKNQSFNSPPTTLSPETPLSDRKIEGDIIVCLRDELKPPAENLVRAYAVSAELLRNTMGFFRRTLENTTEGHEDQGRHLINQLSGLEVVAFDRALTANQENRM
jgi:hypothetical protein